MNDATPTTKAQDKAITRLTRNHGSLFILGQEPGGQSIRIRYAGDEPAKDRERIITPSGLVLEPVA